MNTLELNQRAHTLVEPMLASPGDFNAKMVQLAGGTHLLDLGVHAGFGGLEAGRRLAEICLAGLAKVDFVPGDYPATRTSVQVRTDQPRLACLAAQYAGWQIKGENFFGMGSGPMRLKAGKEPVIREMGLTDNSPMAVGVLETSQLPTDEICQKIATDCQVAPEQLFLLAARTASIAGNVQVVARSVETCLHKLHELDFDLTTIASGYGVAPLPPVAADDVVGIGRTNDAILYGASVTLWVRESTDRLQEVGAKLPSNTSAMYGQPFEKILRDAKFDFYQIDPLLFSPAEVCLVSLLDGQTTIVGERNLAVLATSFGQG
ncbi:methenyltetrahydromethanopterin cyclohydrolase [Bremerella cremea]|uniref:Methenyltetrahydromethanopterin cyclohydrolase n=1 Tax=Bremerella cremea TaxID=1031537 RepID=A0A368KVG2_9BACT|nr:methenyltetrahydromethanopterin cyclohydrolase [Bremerella cremea]RCS54398.1 methenyltetrahydromethanopterin cyclohydrolase [Bremerella cremea]